MVRACNETEARQSNKNSYKNYPMTKELIWYMHIMRMKEDKVTTIVTRIVLCCIRTKELIWYGHVMWMKENKVTKVVTRIILYDIQNKQLI